MGHLLALAMVHGWYGGQCLDINFDVGEQMINRSSWSYNPSQEIILYVPKHCLVGDSMPGENSCVRLGEFALYRGLPLTKKKKAHPWNCLPNFIHSLDVHTRPWLGLILSVLECAPHFQSSSHSTININLRVRVLFEQAQLKIFQWFPKMGDQEGIIHILKLNRRHYLLNGMEGSKEEGEGLKKGPPWTYSDQNTLASVQAWLGVSACRTRKIFSPNITAG